MPEMVAPRALVFRPLVKGNEALGTRLNVGSINDRRMKCASRNGLKLRSANTAKSMRCNTNSGQHQESRPLALSNDIPFLNGFVNKID